MASVEDQITRFDPSFDPLLTLCRENLDEAVLGFIANADYGTAAAQNAKDLTKLLSGQPVEGRGFHPREALELTRWLNPQSEAEGLGESQRHWARIFSSALLLHPRLLGASKAGGSRVSESDHETLAGLIDSARSLGPRVERATLRFVAAALAAGGHDRREPFFWFGLVYLALRVQGEVAADAVDTLVRSEESWASARVSDNGSTAWLLRAEPTFDQRHGLWQSFATDLWFRASEVPKVRVLCERMRPELGSR